VYRGTLPTAYRSLFDRYQLRDAAIKVVGVGSVGTACFVLLLTAGEGDPLFLQVKEASASVLERYAGASVFPNHGQRVVDGYRRMQPAAYSSLRVGCRSGALPGPGSTLSRLPADAAGCFRGVDVMWDSCRQHSQSVATRARPRSTGASPLRRVAIGPLPIYPVASAFFAAARRAFCSTMSR
jgi:hypothetical protein